MLSALLDFCEVHQPIVIGGFLHKGLVMGIDDIFFAVSLNKVLNK